jgi:ribosomal protein L37AE/L43A
MRIAVVALAAAVLPSCSCRKKRAASEPPVKKAADPQWICEACDHAFTAPSAKGVRECPECKKKAAVQRIAYKCGKCTKCFEAYRFVDCTDLEAPEGPKGEPLQPTGNLKIGKDGQWVQDREMLETEIKCPHCNNADTTRMTATTGPPDPS